MWRRSFVRLQRETTSWQGICPLTSVTYRRASSSKTSLHRESHVRGPTNIPLLSATIPQIISSTTSKFPDQDALVSCSQNIKWSYRKFSEVVDRFAAGLVSIGLGKGDRVGIWSPNNWEWAIAQFATARIGAILVNINPAYRSHELKHSLSLVGCKCLIMLPRSRTNDYAAVIGEIAPELKNMLPEPKKELNLHGLPLLKHIVSIGPDSFPGMIRYNSLLERDLPEELGQLDLITHSLKENDPINIQFTSGTTGLPKAATLTHRNIVNNSYFIAKQLHYNHTDRVCIPVPLYHCFGMVIGSLAAVNTGASIVLPSPVFDPELVLASVEKERCTSLYGVPTMFIAQLEHPRFPTFNLTSLRTGVMAGSPCPIEVMKKVMNLMHIKEMTVAYGMTETSPVSFMSDVADPVDRRVSTVGRVMPHVEVKVVDPNTENTTPIGVAGELWSKGYIVMTGYWAQPDKTKEAITKDGWMKTGDMAVIDEQGYCQIVGRYKDVVIRGGEKIFPLEVEQLLYPHPSIQDVQIIGVPDEKYGEQICACIIMKPGRTPLTVEDVVEFLKGKISRFKIPSYVLTVKSYPMTVTGKIQKNVLRDIASKELGLK